MENPFEILDERLQRIENILSDLTQRIYSTKEKENTINEILNVEQVAKYLYLSVPTIYGLIHRREIPHYKVGKRLYFKKDEILELIQKRKVKTIEEIEQDALNSLSRRRRK